MSNGDPETTPGSTPINNAVKLAGETVVPGASLYLHGKMRDGLIHTGLGLVAKAVLGPLGYLLVAANSYSRATTTKDLHEHVFHGE